MKYNIAEFDGLIKIVEEDCGENSRAYINYNNNLVMNAGKADIYIRLNKDKIIIARIAVINERQGCGTKILEWLKDFAISKNINTLEVEQTCTIEICEFCKKHGFKKILNDWSEERNGIYYGSWELKF